jgi:hypothetical protein
MKEKPNPLLSFWAKPQAARMEQKMDMLVEAVQTVEKKVYFMDRRQTGRQTQEGRISQRRKQRETETESREQRQETSTREDKHLTETESRDKKRALEKTRT